MSVADWMAAHGVKSTGDLAQHVDALKTEAYYRRALDKAVQDFYRGGDVGKFIDKFVDLIDGQLTRAWHEGMRNVGLDPAKEMFVDYERQLRGIKDNEYKYVLDYAQAIEDARKAGQPIGPLRDRVDYWVNRYTQVVNEAQVTTRPGDRYEWIYGDTKKHCGTCLTLNGKVMSGDQWAASGYRPQQPPNPMLECGGWRCRCRLEKTDKEITGL